MRFRFLLFIILLFQCRLALADDEYQQVKIADPFIELHTGPGSGYPVFYVADRNEWISIIKRRTDWFLIKTQNGKEGWVFSAQLEQTLTGGGEQTQLKTYELSDFTERKWEMGVGGGKFEGAPSISIYGGYAFSNNLAAELTYSKVIGNFSSSDVIKASLVSQPFPEWRFSPYFSLGTGHISTKARTSLVQPIDRSNQFATIGLGVRTYLTRRVVFRLEYNEYVIFSATTEKDQNEDISEWKAGFTVFF